MSYLDDAIGGPGRAHPACWDATANRYDHDAGGCAAPSHRSHCYVDGCAEPPGTHWTSHWCPRHDAERLNRLSRQLDTIRREAGDLP